MYIAQEGFQFKRIGNAAAMSLMLALFLGLLGALNFVLFRSKDE